LLLSNYAVIGGGVAIHMAYDSVSIVSDHRLDDRTIRVRSGQRQKDFSSRLCVQTSSQAHPASYPMCTRGPFPGSKVQLGCDTDHSPHL